MCHLAAFSPGFPRELAITLVVSNFTKKGPAYGLGAAWAVKGKLKCTKLIAPLDNGNMFTKDQLNQFLDHMPCSSWTVAHFKEHSLGTKPEFGGYSGRLTERSWTDGPEDNCHPWIYGDWALGQLYGCQKETMDKIFQLNCRGIVDSERAAAVLGKIGPHEFVKQAHKYCSAVNLAVHKSGKLFVDVTNRVTQYAKDGLMCFTGWENPGTDWKAVSRRGSFMIMKDLQETPIE